MRVPQPQRVLILGSTGSGKSTLAARVSERTGLRFVHTDDLIWEPGWVLVDEAEKQRRIADVLLADRWVLDAVPSSCLAMALARADQVVGLDYPRWLSLQRLVRRTARRVITRESVCNGNTESLRETFSRNSIFAWHFRTFTRNRRRMRALEADRTAPPVVRLTSQRETDAWLRSLRAG